MKSGTTNIALKKLIVELKKTKKPIWANIAERLERPRRNKTGVNVWKINAYTKEGDTVVVPGKVLSDGELDHKVNVAALNFSKSAEAKIKKSGSTMTIGELAKKNAKGTKVIIMQ